MTDNIPVTSNQNMPDDRYNNAKITENPAAPPLESAEDNPVDIFCQNLEKLLN